MEEANQLLRDAALTNKVTLEIEFDVAGLYIYKDTINFRLHENPRTKCFCENELVFTM